MLLDEDVPDSTYVLRPTFRRMCWLSCAGPGDGGRTPHPPALTPPRSPSLNLTRLLASTIAASTAAWAFSSLSRSVE